MKTWLGALFERGKSFTHQNSREQALCQEIAALKAENEALQAFAHTVAHDLKTPLSLIVGFAELVEETLVTEPEDDARAYVHNIIRTSHKMSSIIDELLLLAEMRESKLRLTPLDMGRIVARAQRRLRPMIKDYAAQIVTPATWPRARGYEPWIEQVWVNYLSNAIKYGGRPPRLQLGATIQGDGQACFWVRDNGPGLTPEQQARVFTPFERLEQVRTQGHGLGLVIVRDIVERLGGEVDVESQVGEGSVFAFTLPTAEKFKLPEDTPPRRAPSP